MKSFPSSTPPPTAILNSNPNPNPKYLDPSWMGKLLQPQLLSLVSSLQLDPDRVPGLLLLMLDQPDMVLSAECYRCMNQIMDQLIMTIINNAFLSSSSSSSSSSSNHKLELTTPPPNSAANYPLLNHHHLNHLNHLAYPKLIHQVMAGSLAIRCIHTAQLGLESYHHKLEQSQTNKDKQEEEEEETNQRVSFNDVFLQLQIDCQILSPSATTKQTTTITKQTTTTITKQTTTELLEPCLNLLLDPTQFNLKLDAYHQQFNTLHLSLRNQPHPRNTANTILQHPLTIYLVSLIHAFTHYILHATTTIIIQNNNTTNTLTTNNTPIPIQAHQLLHFFAQDNQIIHLKDMIHTLQAKAIITLIQPSPLRLTPPLLPKKKSLNLKPLLLTPKTTQNRLLINTANSPTTTTTTTTTTTLLFQPIITTPTAPPLHHAHPLQPTLDLPFQPTPSNWGTTHPLTSPPSSPLFDSTLSDPTAISHSDAHPQYVVYPNNSPITIPTTLNPPPPNQAPLTAHRPVHGSNRHTFGQAPTPPPLAEIQPPQGVPPSAHYYHDDRRADPRLQRHSGASHTLSPPAPPRSFISSTSPPPSPSSSPSSSPGHHSPSTLDSLACNPSFGSTSTRTPPRSRSEIIMSPPVGLPIQPPPSSISHSHGLLQQQQQQQETTRPISLKQGLSAVSFLLKCLNLRRTCIHLFLQPSSKRISFEQLIRSNETVKFSLTPTPCLDGSSSPMSPHSTLSGSPTALIPDALAVPFAITPVQSLSSSALLPRFELRPKVRRPSAADLDGHLTDDPIDALSPVDLSHALRPGAQKIQLKPAHTMSSMSQRIAAARTPDSTVDPPHRRGQPLQSLAEILQSDPPWLDPKPNTITFNPRRTQPARPDQQLDFEEALALATPQPIQLDAWSTDQHLRASASSKACLPVAGKSGSLEPLIPYRVGPPSNKDGLQTADAHPSSGLQKTLRGFKSMISRRKRGKEEAQHGGLAATTKAGYWTAADRYSNSVGSRNQSFDHHTISLSGFEAEPPRPRPEPVTRNRADPAEDFVENKRSRLGRSISMSSLARRPSTTRAGTPKTRLSKPRTPTPRSGATVIPSTAASTLTHPSRRRFNSSIGSLKMFQRTILDHDDDDDDDDDDNNNHHDGVQVDDGTVADPQAMGLATRLGRRLRASVEHKRAQSVDSVQPDWTRARQVEARANTLYHKNHHHKKNNGDDDEEIGLGFRKDDEGQVVVGLYYDSSSQSTAIDEEMLHSHGKDHTDPASDPPHPPRVVVVEQLALAQPNDGLISVDQLRRLIVRLAERVDGLSLLPPSFPDHHPHLTQLTQHATDRQVISGINSITHPPPPAVGISRHELLQMID